MISCKEATQLISQSMDADLSFWKRLGLKTHLLLCRLCSRFKTQMNFLAETLKVYRTNYETSDNPSFKLTGEARERLKVKLRESGDFE